MGNFSNHFLIAMPHLNDVVFKKSLVFLCEHDDQGAMGLIINKPMSLTDEINQVLAQTRLNRLTPFPRIYFGGPVGVNRGFFLHDSTYQIEGTYKISDKLALTTNPQIIKDILEKRGPEHFRFALGYAGWGEKQLEREIENGDWLVMPATPEMIFDIDDEQKWEQAARHFGIDILDISGQTGLA